MATAYQAREINELCRRLRRKPLNTEAMSDGSARRILTLLDREVNRKLASSVHRKELLY